MFEMISELLAKEAGLDVRNQVVQLLYMLLNCKFLHQFCFSRSFPFFFLISFFFSE